MLVFCALVMFLVSISLLLHHAYSHPELTGMARFFQSADVGNFHSCSHEMWILLLGTVGVLLLGTHFFLVVTNI
jgi:hypothetical protein